MLAGLLLSSALAGLAWPDLAGRRLPARLCCAAAVDRPHQEHVEHVDNLKAPSLPATAEVGLYSPSETFDSPRSFASMCA